VDLRSGFSGAAPVVERVSRTTNARGDVKLEGHKDHYDLVREVVNPSKDHKLDEVASRYQIDPVEFKRVGRQLRRVWPLLP
jgi:hypothetical protein